MIFHGVVCLVLVEIHNNVELAECAAYLILRWTLSILHLVCCFQTSMLQLENGETWENYAKQWKTKVNKQVHDSIIGDWLSANIENVCEVW